MYSLDPDICLQRASQLRAAGRSNDAFRLLISLGGNNKFLNDILKELELICLSLGPAGNSDPKSATPNLPSSIDLTSSQNASVSNDLDMSKVCFCTYFDSRYAVRALAMIDSLRQHLNKVKIYVLCFDSQSENIVRMIYGGDSNEVAIIALSEITSHDNDFLYCKNNRSLIEWYFTSTSVLLNYLICERLHEDDFVVYLDADLYFFSSPSCLLEEATGYSAQIVPHRFPVELSHLAIHGNFNVGWVLVRNNSTGRKIVNDYRQDCIQWCYDRVDGPRFADQKYLDYWLPIYRNVKISNFVGANVAPWNAIQYSFTQNEECLKVDSSNMIFYHFHGLKRISSSLYKLSEHYKYPKSNVFTTMYENYIRGLLQREMLLEESGIHIDNSSLR